MLIQNWVKTCMANYSNRDPVNLSDVFIKVRVASKITLLCFRRIVSHQIKVNLFCYSQTKTRNFGTLILHYS